MFSKMEKTHTDTDCTLNALMTNDEFAGWIFYRRQNDKDRI